MQFIQPTYRAQEQLPNKECMSLHPYLEHEHQCVNASFLTSDTALMILQSSLAIPGGVTATLVCWLLPSVSNLQVVSSSCCSQIFNSSDLTVCQSISPHYKRLKHVS
uniref:Uncharacterized protein n=1 Tax=Stegastes partitus TaxID=144197 RepID=A0A3B4ZZ88_9TELE